MAIPRNNGAGTQNPNSERRQNAPQKPANAPAANNERRVAPTQANTNKRPAEGQQRRLREDSERVPQQKQRPESQKHETNQEPNNKNVQQRKVRRKLTVEEQEQLRQKQLQAKKQEELRRNKALAKAEQEQQASNKKTVKQSSRTNQGNSAPVKQSSSVSSKKLINDSEIPEGYAVDPVTGIRYKKLPAATREILRADKKSGGLSIEQMRTMIGEAEDFNLDDLNGAADMFLGHLRIAPDKEEIQRLRDEKIAQAKKQNSEYGEVQERLNEKLGDLEPNPDEVWKG